MLWGLCWLIVVLLSICGCLLVYCLVAAVGVLWWVGLGFVAFGSVVFVFAVDLIFVACFKACMFVECCDFAL